jgi:hypothetical protein
MFSFTGLRNFIGYHAEQIAIGVTVVGLGAVSYLGLSWLLGGKSKDDAGDSKVEELNENGLVSAEKDLSKTAIENNVELHFDAAMTSVSVEPAAKEKEQATYDLASSEKGNAQTEGLQVEYYNGKQSFGDPMPVGEEFLVNTYTSNAQSWPSVAVLADGGFVVIWDGYGQANVSVTGIYGQRYNSNGAPQGSNFLVNTYTSLSNQSSPSVASLIDGGFVVTWVYGFVGIYGQLYNSGGVSQGSNFLVNTGTSVMVFGSSMAVLTDGSFILAWLGEQVSSDVGIYGQLYNSTGISQGNNFLMSSTGYISSNAHTSVTSLINGGFVVTWCVAASSSDCSSINVKLYNAAGVAQGSEFSVNNTYTRGFEYRHSVASLIDGDFVVIWGWYGKIYGQLYNGTGIPQGSNFAVSDDTHEYAGLSCSLSTAGLTNGGFVVVWDDYKQGYLSNTVISGQLYDNTGIPQGGNFLVSTYTSDKQFDPSVARLSDGGFIVVWVAFPNPSYAHYRIYGRMFSSETAPTVTTQPVQSTTTLLGQNTTTIPNATTASNIPLIASVSAVGGIAVLATALTVGICFWRKKHAQDEKRHRVSSATNKNKDNEVALTEQNIKPPVYAK